MSTAAPVEPPPKRRGKAPAEPTRSLADSQDETPPTPPVGRQDDDGEDECDDASLEAPEASTPTPAAPSEDQGRGKDKAKDKPNGKDNGR